MIRQPVASSNLRSIGYEPASQTLEIEFVAGRVYQYAGVPEHVFRGLMSANSHGAYFDSFIRDAGFAFLRIR